MPARDDRALTGARGDALASGGDKVSARNAPLSVSATESGGRPKHGRRRRDRRRPASTSTSSPAAVAVLALANGGGVVSSAAAFASASMHSGGGGRSPISALLRFAKSKRGGGNDSGSDVDSDDDGETGDDRSYSRRRLSLPSLLARRPDALLAAAVPRPAVLFGAGAAAGALGKTITAPLDRVKLLLQTSGGFETGAIAAATKGASKAGAQSVGRQGLRSLSRVAEALAAIGKQEGIGGYWRGNLPQILKVVPYSATQLCAYELFKKALATEVVEGGEPTPSLSSKGSKVKRAPNKSKTELTVRRRLAAGAAAGMVATLATHPLDTLRLRMAVDPAAKTLPAAVKILLRSGGGGAGAPLGGVRAFYRGLGASIVGIAPYMAIELCTFDTLATSALPPFARGLAAAGLATVLCYPLDTARRRVQLGVVSSAAASSLSGVDAAVREGKLLATAVAVAREEGFASLYRGFLPSCLKNLPNKGVKLSVFDGAKRALAASEAALEDEKERVRAEEKRRRERRRRRRRRSKGGGLFGGLFGGGGGGEKKATAALLH